jgi:hypothetical protein
MVTLALINDVVNQPQYRCCLFRLHTNINQLAEDALEPLVRDS